MAVITKDMAMFSLISAKITPGMIDNINKSPTFVAQLVQYNNAVLVGKALPIDLTYGAANDKGSYLTTRAGGKAQIMLDSTDRWATGVNTNYTDEQGVLHTITPVGEFGGLLSHEIGHFVNMVGDAAAYAKVKDSDPGAIDTRTSLLVYREGEGAYNNWVIRNETKANGGAEVDLRGANYKFADTPSGGIYSNLLAQMDKIGNQMAAAGSPASEIKMVLQDISASYIANAHPSTEPDNIYWNTLKSQLIGQPVPTNEVSTKIELTDSNRDGWFEKILNFKSNGSLEANLSGPQWFTQSNATVNVAPNSQGVILDGSGLRINAGVASSVIVGGNGQNSTDAQLNTVYEHDATVSIRDDSRVNVYSTAVGNETGGTVWSGRNDNFGAYGNAMHVHGNSTSNIWIGGNGKSSAFTYLDSMNGGTAVIVDNSHVDLNNYLSTSTPTWSKVFINGSNSIIDIHGSKSGGYTINMDGNNNILNDYDWNEVINNNGSGNLVNAYGEAITSYTKGNYDHTNNFAGHNQSFSYGSYNKIWSAFPLITAVYLGNSTNTTSSTQLVIYGVFYGMAGNESKIKSNIEKHNSNITDLFDKNAVGTNISEAAQHGLELLSDTIELGIVNAVTGAKWDKAEVSWSISSLPAHGTGIIDRKYVQTVREAFQEWAEVTGIHFKELKGDRPADIHLGWANLNTQVTGVAGYTSLITDSGHIRSGVNILLENPAESPLVGGKKGESVYTGTDSTLSQVLLHEIGHAIGLASSADVNSIEAFYLGESNRTLSEGDIATAKALYNNSDAATIIAPIFDPIMDAMWF